MRPGPCDACGRLDPNPYRQDPATTRPSQAACLCAACWENAVRQALRDKANQAGFKGWLRSASGHRIFRNKRPEDSAT